jgi:HSP20 family molecular chaperone IbpA
LSAKWRRSKRDSNRFNIFKAFSRVRKKSVQTLDAKNSKNKKHAYSNRSRVLKVHAEKKIRELEPLIDVLEEKEAIIVVAELAGYNEENLRVRVRNQRLTLSAETLDRKYYKSLNLPKRVIPSTIRTTYKNGVLEVQLKKAVEEKAIDKVAG